MKVTLYNTLTRKKEEFRPLEKGRVGLYTCGPTVYNFAHIGNLRTYIFEDVLRRTLEKAGYEVKHVMNITDVGHLTSDADEGEDKLEKGAAREGKTVWDLAKFYTDAFLSDIDRLNIRRAGVLAPATGCIPQQIGIIERLFEKGFAYETLKAVYFDISKFADYGALSGQKLSEKVSGAREEVVVDEEKRNPGDFALWFKTVGRFEHHIMHWPSPWGEGFPGWHIECSAISTANLGQPFDIHTGGIDHVAVHHTNEIAQSVGAFGKPLANVWMHGEFLLIDEAKMAKSGENFFTLQSLINKGFDPIVFRYLCLTAHYRSKLNFTWDSLEAARSSLGRLREFVRELVEVQHSGGKDKKAPDEYEKKFNEALADDLNTPEALAAVWTFIHDYRKAPDEFSAKAVLGFLYGADTVFGLGLKEIQREEIPAAVATLVREREEHRKNKEWAKADEVRKKIQECGFLVEDTADGPKAKKA